MRSRWDIQDYPARHPYYELLDADIMLLRERDENVFAQDSSLARRRQVASLLRSS